jgi:Cdc6-like AAA superfamily ATPase
MKTVKFRVGSSEPQSTKPRFIVLCGPTGVGKSMVPEQVFNLKKEDFTKIEIDSLVVQNQLYISTIYTINKLSPKLISTTINEEDTNQHNLLTNLFNTLYFNVKNNIIPCLENDPKKEKITCS